MTHLLLSMLTISLLTLCQALPTHAHMLSNRLWADSAQYEMIICFLLLTTTGMALRATWIVHGFVCCIGTCCCQSCGLEAGSAVSKRAVPAHCHCFCCSEPCAWLWDPTLPVPIARSSTSVRYYLVTREDVSWLRVLGKSCLSGVWEDLGLISCSRTSQVIWDCQYLSFFRYML